MSFSKKLHYNVFKELTEPLHVVREHIFFLEKHPPPEMFFFSQKKSVNATCFSSSRGDLLIVLKQKYF